MKNLVYFIVIVVFGFSCSKQAKIENGDYEYVYVDPDSVPLDYSYVDSLDSVYQETRAYSYKVYGDSDMMDRIVTEGLPDSMKLHNR